MSVAGAWRPTVGAGLTRTLGITNTVLPAMSIADINANTPENRARYRPLLIVQSDGELKALLTSTPDNAAGIEASVILAERESTRSADKTEIERRRHKELLIIGVIGTVAGIVAAVFAYLSYVQQLQPASQAQPSAQTSASAAQKSASSSSPQIRSSASQPQGR